MKSDVYDKITASIIEALEKGVAPWVKPWKGGTPYPVNAMTGKPYHGMNVFILWATAYLKEFSCDRWLTYKQAESLGAQVRKGEKGISCIFYSIREKDQELPDGSTETFTYPVARAFTLFNVDQIDGLTPEFKTGLESQDVSKWDENNTLADAIEQGAAIQVIEATQAYYSPVKDHVAMPAKTAFVTAEDYYATKLHEFGHWTGHKDRLNRDLSGTFGTESYAFEELIAEMTAAFLCAEAGIEGKLQHPEYIASWLKVLKNDNKAVIEAAKQAKKASGFLLSKVTDVIEDTEIIEEELA